MSSPVSKYKDGERLITDIWCKPLYSTHSFVHYYRHTHKPILSINIQDIYDDKYTKNQISILPDKILEYIQLYDTCKS